MPEIIYRKNNLRLTLMCLDGERRIIGSQPFTEFIHGKRDLTILQGYYEPELFRILVEDAGYVRCEDNKFSLKTILEIDTMRTVMRMMGKIAEAVIVRRCRDNEDINLNWLRIASRKRVRMETAKKFEAWGTGLESKKRHILNTIIRRIRRGILSGPWVMEKYPTMKNAVLASTFESIPSDIQIIH